MTENNTTDSLTRLLSAGIPFSVSFTDTAVIVEVVNVKGQSRAGAITLFRNLYGEAVAIKHTQEKLRLTIALSEINSLW